MSYPIVFSDMDGSLLDHDDYSFSAAETALAELNRLGIPLILASSKTRLEMQQWQTRLGLESPFICENGGAICWGGGTTAKIEALALPRQLVLEQLSSLREQGYQFTGFADMSVEELASLTGLGLADATLAAAREYSEPILWQDSSDRLSRFIDELGARGLFAQQGGRFLSISSGSDKALAMEQVADRLAAGRACTIIALGDSPNDEAMLAQADVAVIINSPRAEEIDLGETRAGQLVIRTRESGPHGWQEAMLPLLKKFEQERNNHG